MSDDIRIEVPEILAPEASVTLPANVVATYQLIVHPITHEVITITSESKD
jgi:hypothetical protein